MSDALDLDISTDGGTIWANLLRWNEDHGGFFEAPGEAVEVDLSAYLGQGGLILRWCHYDSATDDWDWYAQIDEVGLVCCAPAIEITPGFLSSIQQPDTEARRMLTLANSGVADLEWSILETPASCAAPFDIPWLSVSPTAGTAPAGSEILVEVTLDATGLAPATCTATLCVVSNDPAVPTTGVPVTMEVVGCVDNLVLGGTVVTGGTFTAGISVSGGPGLSIDGPVVFTAQKIRLQDGVEIRDGFSAASAASPCS